MNYSDSLEWLFSQTRSGKLRDKKRITEILNFLGNPQDTFPSVRVIGTNGKGSVAAFMEAGLKSSGIRFGVTVSPHVNDFRERIRTHNGPIPEAEVVIFLNKLKSFDFENQPSFFDIVTAMAFDHFARNQVELALVEAGVGGVSDDTDILENIKLIILTTVGLDHVPTLGNTLEQIANEKASAIRFGVPVICGWEPSIAEVAREIADAKSAPFYLLSEGGELFRLPTKPVLQGEFQYHNAALAAAGLRLLGFAEPGVRSALEHAVHPGRMEEFQYKGARVILDGAHNPQAARALVKSLTHYHLVYGAFGRKDFQAMLDILLPKARSVRFSRAGEGALGAETFEGDFFEDPKNALESALACSSADGFPVLVTGSFYLVGSVRAELLSALL